MDPKHLLLILMAVLVMYSPKLCAQEQAQIPDGYQRVFIRGYVRDSNGQPLEAAEISASFNTVTLKTTCSGKNGLYGMMLENFGGIRHVTLIATKDGYSNGEEKKVDIVDSAPEADFSLVKFGEVDYRQIRYWDSLMNDPAYLALCKRSRICCFSEYEGDYPHVFGFFPMNYLDKISFKARITDRAGTPIPQAKVELRFANNKTRFGFSDAYGRATLHSQLDGAAMKGRIKVSAEGYRSRFVTDYHFLSKTYVYPFRLRKKKIREACALTEIPTEQTQPIADKKVLTATDKPLDVTLYPNPAKDQLQVQTAGATIQKLEILDLTGKKVLQREHIDSHTVRIPVDELKNGVYFVTLQCGGQTVTKVLHVVR